MKVICLGYMTTDCRKDKIVRYLGLTCEGDVRQRNFALCYDIWWENVASLGKGTSMLSRGPSWEPGIRQVEQAMHRSLALVAESIQSYKGRSLRETAEAGHDNRAGDLYAKRSHFHTDRVQVIKAPNSNIIGCQDDGCLAFSQTQHGICKPGSTKLLSIKQLFGCGERTEEPQESSSFVAFLCHNQGRIMTLHVRQCGQTPRLSVGYQQLSARESVTSFCKLRMGGSRVVIQDRSVLALILISAKDKQPCHRPFLSVRGSMRGHHCRQRHRVATSGCSSPKGAGLRFEGLRHSIPQRTAQVTGKLPSRACIADELLQRDTEPFNQIKRAIYPLSAIRLQATEQLPATKNIHCSVFTLPSNPEAPAPLLIKQLVDRVKKAEASSI